MKLSRFSVFALLMLFATSLLGGCSSDEGIDNRDHDYGYIQFKLYKQASYEAAEGDKTPTSRATTTQLDYLADACKVEITLLSNGSTISQTLTLSATSSEAAEYGLRSGKIKLLTGDYEIVNFTLYDALDEILYNGTTTDNQIRITAGGLTVHDLTVNVEPRGKVQFTITKDIADFTQTPTRSSATREYTFDEVAFVDVTVRNTTNNERTTFERLPSKFSIHFDDDEDTFGYQTSSSACDSLLSIKAGSYRLVGYKTYDENKVLLETNDSPKSSTFTVLDNKTTKANVPVTLHEADQYLRDYYALYEIWKSLDGQRWYYNGENWGHGANWDFNKDPDLWGDQPGVKLHSNGRVAAIDISDFGFRGVLPAAVGQLTELIELYLGTHNDKNLIDYDPTVQFGISMNGGSRTRLERAKEYMSIIQPITQMSEPIARALAEKKIKIPEIALYEKYTEDQIRDKKTGRQLPIQPYDMIHGKLCNGLKSIDPAIGKLEKLEYLYLANGELESLPDELANLKSLTDLELYNCSKMTKFPLVLAKLPSLVLVNFANNAQWSSEEVYAGLDALANGASKEKIQIFYFRDNRLKELPESFKQMKKLSLLDMAYNELETIHPLGKGVALVQLFLDHNKLTELPCDADGYFIGYDDLETISATYNEFTKVPNIFNAKSVYSIKSVDFSHNHMDGFEGEDDGSFRGINIETLTIAGNKEWTKYPKCLSDSESRIAYLNASGCNLSEFPKGSFTGKNVYQLTSLDLTYNRLSDFPNGEFTAVNLPYLYGLDISYNRFASFPFEPLNSSYLTVFAIRGQRDANGERCLQEWPTGLYQHKGLRGFYIGSNDLRKVDDTISHLIYYLDISDNPNIVFDASKICYYYKAGAYFLIYDKTQNIKNCDYLFQ